MTFVEWLLPANTDPTQALLVGMLVGVLLMSGRGGVVFAAKLIKSLRTGKWDLNGHAEGRHEEVIERLRDIDRQLAEVANHQVKNYRSMRDLIGSQGDHDTSTALALENIKGSIKRLLDRADLAK